MVIVTVLIVLAATGLAFLIIAIAYCIGEKKKRSGQKVSLGLDFLGHGLKYTKFKCSHCGHVVEISSGRRFLGPHLPRQQYIKCPKCCKRSWMKTTEI